MTSPIATLQNVSKKIKGKTIVNNVSFDISPGEIVGFLGPNGSGKTTTMKMMVGLMSITKGDIIINGYSVRNHKEQALKYVSGIIEYPEMYKFLSGYDNLVHFQRITGKPDKEKILQLSTLVGLTDAIHEKVKTYSLGMKQRLGLAQALLYSPKLLLLDEPTNGLDPAGIRKMRVHLKNIAKTENIAILMSSHLLSEVEQICDRLIIFHKGQFVESEYIDDFYKAEKESYFSIKTDSNEKAIDILSNFNRNVVIKNDYILLFEKPESIPEMIETLVTNKVKIYSVSPITESLEERYLAKISGDL
jgi:ABC-2 type transport system ATP-binding protein